MEGRVSRSKWQQMKAPSHNISLAVSAILPEVFVQIETLWVDEVVLDKRKSTDGSYEYLVKAKGMSKLCAVWKSPVNIMDPELVRLFEQKRVNQIKDKTHLAAWYPFKEEMVVRWKNTPFFIVSYGGGQFNKFCIVANGGKGNASAAT